MQVIEDRNFLFEILKNGGTLVTPNNRLTEHLLLKFYSYKALKVQEKPACYSYSLFLRNLYNKIRHLYPGVSHPILLSAQQEFYLWQQACPEDEGVLKKVEEAWKLCKLWQLDTQQEKFKEKEASLKLQTWSFDFEKKLEKFGLITECQLPQYLGGFPELFNDQKLAWVCFDSFNPSQNYLQEILAKNNCQQFIYDLAERTTAIQKFTAQDIEDEFNEIISWTKTKVASAKRIAIVIPNLENSASQLERLFSQYFRKEEFNLSFGKPLISYPIISHAVEFLKINTEFLHNSQAILLLQSPYLKNSASEFILRSEFMQDAKIIKQRYIDFNLYCDQLSKKSISLGKILTNMEKFPESATISTWLNLFKNRLKHLEFPGEYTLNSENYQCLQKFLNLLDEFLQFNLLSDNLNQSDAVKALEFLCKNTIFQAKKEYSQIQILGLLEASGCDFDCIWMAGLTDQSLPEKTRFSAFIPISMQKDLGMPYSSPLQELNLAKLRLQRLRNSCEEMVVSYPIFTNEAPNLASPLIKDFPSYTQIERAKNQQNSQLLEAEESYQLALAPNETISGGTNILAYQAQCPFRAFAAHRLYARPSLETVDGLDPIDRGQLIHKMLELIWLELKTQAKLIALKAEDLQKIIEKISIKVLNTFFKENKKLSQLMLDAELIRLQRLTLACLEWEKQRPQFNVVALEKEFNFVIEDIEIKVRIDRLDEVANGKWVIDYKTSFPQIKPWNEERPEAPQLLLYALLDEEISALLYLELKNGRVQCNGLSANPINLAGIKSLKKDESWSNYQNQWQQQLKLLANEFKQGYCQPQPSRPSICLQCDYISLCRFSAVTK